MTVRDDGPANGRTDGRAPDADEAIHCTETLPVGDPERVVVDAFEGVENSPLREDLPPPTVAVRYRPVVDVESVTRSTFETNAGVVHRIDDRDHVVLEADAGGPRVAPDDLVDLVGVSPVPLQDTQADFGGEAVPFAGTAGTYREWATERLCDVLAETVSYEGRGGETYTTECRPSLADVSVQSVRPVYVPGVEVTVELGEYAHRYAYDAAGDRHVEREDGIRSCDHCETAGAESATYTYCENCGSVACETHVETERLTGDPVCTGCAVTEEFWFATKHFFDEENAETFREAYDDRPFYRKPTENPHLVASVALVACLLLAVAAVALV